MNQVYKESKQKLTSGGLRAFLATLLLLVALIGINLLASLLPASVTELDISPLKMYSVSDTTKRELAKIKTEVDIYMVVSGGEGALANEGLHVKTFLEKFPSYGKRIDFEVIDTVAKPTFHTTLGLSEAPENLSIIVKSGKRLRVITQSELFYYYIDGIGKIDASEVQQYVYMMQMYGQTVTPLYYFDGESKLLSALDYVTADTLPTVYALTGHDELGIPETLADELDANNIGLATLGLIQSGSIPEDCSLLIINTPAVDITDNESSLIASYLEKGGKLMLITAPDVSKLENLMSLTAAYGLLPEDGIVIENDSNHYYQYPYYLFPTVGSHSATGTLSSSKYILLPWAHGITFDESISGVNRKAIFSSGTSSHIVAVDAETTARPEGQEAAAHTVGAVAETDNGTKLVWIASSGFANDSANSYTAGGNYAYFLSAVKWACKTAESILISPLPMETPRLVVPSASAGIWFVILTIIIPIGILAVGLIYWIRRRKK